MDTQSIEKDLATRIEAGRTLWNDGNPPALSPIPIKRGSKSYDCAVAVIGIVDRPDRKSEKNGLVFRLELPATNPRFAGEVEIRIKAELTEGPTDDSPPYVVVYRRHPEESNSGSTTALFWEQYRRANEYTALARLSDEDWYARFISRAARDHFAAVFDKVQ